MACAVVVARCFRRWDGDVRATLATPRVLSLDRHNGWSDGEEEKAGMMATTRNVVLSRRARNWNLARIVGAIGSNLDMCRLA